jgi:hypothetical protein
VSILENPVRLLGTLLEQLHFGQRVYWHHVDDHASVPDLIIGTHLFFVYVYPTSHACCVADTNLHTSLSACSTSVTDTDRPDFVVEWPRFGIV